MFRAAVGPHRARARRRLPARAGLGHGPVQRAGRLDALDASARPAGLRRDAPQRRQGRRRHPGARARHRGPDAGQARSSCPTSASWAPRGGSASSGSTPPTATSSATTAAPSGRTPSCGWCPEAGPRRRAADQRRRRHLALPRRRRPRPRGAQPASRLPALPVPPAEPERIDASRFVGTYSAEVFDLDRQPGRRRPDLDRDDPEGDVRGARREARAQRARRLPRGQPDPAQARPRHAPAARRSSATTATATRSTSTSVAPSGAPAPDTHPRHHRHRTDRNSHEAEHCGLLRPRPLASPRPSPAAAATTTAVAARTATATAAAAGGDSKYVDGGTFTMSLAGDPGKLDPQSSASTQLFTVNQLAYDNLVSVDGEDRRDPVAARDGLDGRRHDRHPHPRPGHHLLRRQRLHRDHGRRQPQLRGRPEEQEPLPRHLPAGRRDREGRRRRRHRHDHARRSRRRSCSTASASLPMVCASGMQDRKSLADQHRRHRPLRAHRGRARATTTPTRSATATPGDRTAPRRRRRACPTPSS